MGARSLSLSAALVLLGTALVSAQTTCPAGSSSVRFPGFDVTPGVNLARSLGSNEASCLTLCSSTSGCGSAVFFMRGGRATCFLKSAGIEARVAPAGTASPETNQMRFVALGCVADAVVTPPAGGCAAGTVSSRFPSFDISPGSNIAVANGLTEAACSALCFSTAGCASAVRLTFSTSRAPACYLKSAAVSARVAAPNSRYVALGCAAPAVTPPTGTCPAGTTSVRYPSSDNQPGTNLLRQSGLDEAACLALCLSTTGCASAVHFLAGSRMVCYLKSAGVASRVPAANTLTVIGCGPIVPPCDGTACASVGAQCAGAGLTTVLECCGTANCVSMGVEYAQCFASGATVPTTWLGQSLECGAYGDSPIGNYN